MRQIDAPPCPSVEQLKQLTTGILSDPPATELESHLLECPLCQEATASMRLEETFIQAVRDGALDQQKAAAQLDGEDQARVERIIADMSGLHRGSMRSRSEEEVEGKKDGTDQSVHPTKDDAERLLAELAGTWLPVERTDELGRLGVYRVVRLLGAAVGGVFLAE